MIVKKVWRRIRKSAVKYFGLGKKTMNLDSQPKSRCDHYIASTELIQFESKIESLGFKYINSGASRHTYHRGNVVIKIPRNNIGKVDNITEAEAWKHYHKTPTKQGIHLAPCKMLSNGCLMMVAVEPEYDNKYLPDWAFRLDGQQVGRYKDKLVAYDYALDVPDIRAMLKEKLLFK